MTKIAFGVTPTRPGAAATVGRRAAVLRCADVRRPSTAKEARHRRQGALAVADGAASTTTTR